MYPLVNASLVYSQRAPRRIMVLVLLVLPILFVVLRGLSWRPILAAISLIHVIPQSMLVLPILAVGVLEVVGML